MAEAVLVAEGLCKRFGAVVAADDLHLEVRRGEIHALIGPNGAGKTSVINQLAGELRPDAGTIRLEGRDITALPVHRRAQLGLARSFQITALFDGMSAEDNVALAVQAHAGHSFRFLRRARAEGRLREPARRLLAEVGLAQATDRPVADLSHGEKRRLELAMVLAGAPKVLLLDEPMAGAGPEAARELAGLLASLRHRAPMLVVEHDMDVVFSLADRITVLAAGATLACGTPAEIRADPQVRAVYLGERH
jgi:branched-chain amino acid transport system ATP-binding protein